MTDTMGARSITAGATSANQVPRYDFHGHPVRRLTYRGAVAFIAREVGVALGYDHAGKRFVSQLTSEWASEIREEVHWFRVNGDELREIKALLRLGTAVGTASVPTQNPAVGTAVGTASVPTPDPLLKTPELVLLTERGLNLAVLRSGRPLGEEFREWLASEVAPQIARTGRYDPAPPLLRAPKRSREMMALKRIVAAAIDFDRLDVAAEFIDAFRRLHAGPGDRLLPPPARLRASNRLVAHLIQRGALKGKRHGLLFQQSSWRPAEKAVLALLLDLADADQRIEGHSHQDLAERLDLTKWTVTQALGVLERAGVIRCMREDRATNRYVLDLEALAGWNGKERPAEWDLGGAGT
jgi:prophage antirepressor-like protein/DNA-binding MarR family transcriptional regulator